MFTQNQINWLNKNCLRPWINPNTGIPFDVHYVTINGVEYIMDLCANSTEIYGLMLDGESVEHDLPSKDYEELCQNIYNTIPEDSHYE